MALLSIGLEAMKSGDPVEYQRYYQQQSDVCMLRLFDSFTESAPQLVFHVFVMIQRRYIDDMPAEQIAWTAMSALASLVGEIDLYLLCSCLFITSPNLIQSV